MFFKNKKRENDNSSVNQNTLNIKEDSNITYEELSKDEEIRRAKEELEKVKKELLVKEQEANEAKKREIEVNESRIENIVNRKLSNQNMNVVEEKKVVNSNTIDEDLLDRKIENIVNEKLAKEKENTIKTAESKVVDVSKYNNLLNKETKEVEKDSTSTKEEKNEYQKTSEEIEYEKVSEATKEKIIDEYLKRFYNENKKDSSNVIAEIKDNKENNETNKIEQLQTNINNEFKEEKKSSLYEELEEENAIISYDELKKAANFGYTDEEMNNYEDEKDAIISIDELEKLYKEINNIKDDSKSMTSTKEEFVIPSYEYKTVKDLPEISSEKIFKRSDIISPIYGVEELDSKTKSDTLIIFLSSLY
jgi:hypothetical protein